MSTTMTSQQRTASIRQYQGETVVYIPLSELHPFPDQPFKVRDDKAMAETVESVREYGVLTPATVRPCGRGGYEIVSGHRWTAIFSARKSCPAKVVRHIR